MQPHRVLRAGVFRTLSVGVLVVAVAWAVLSWGGSRLAARRLASLTGFTVEASDLDVLVWPPGVALDRVRVAIPERNVPFLEATRVELALRLALGLPPPRRAAGGGSGLVLIQPRFYPSRFSPTQGWPHPESSWTLPTIGASLTGVVTHRESGARLVRARIEVEGAPAPLRIDHRQSGDGSWLRTRLSSAGVEIASLLPAAAPFGWRCSGRARGWLRYRARFAGDAQSRRMAGDLDLRAPSCRAVADDTLVAARSLRLRGGGLDLERRRIGMGSLWVSHPRLARAPREAAALDAAPPSPEAEGDEASVGGSDWRVDVGRLVFVNGRLETGIPGLPALVVRTLHGRRLSTASPDGVYRMNGVIASGGSVRASGRGGLRGRGAEGRITLEDVNLPALLRPLASGLKVTGGVARASLALASHPELATGGSFVVDGLEIAAPESGSERSLARCSRLAGELGGISALPPAVRLRELELESPTLTLTRDADGFHPLHELYGDGDPAPGAAGPAHGAGPRNAVRELLALLSLPDPASFWWMAVDEGASVAIKRGTVEFEDGTVDPPVRDVVRDLGLQVQYIPASERGTGGIHGRLGGGAALVASGSLNAGRLRVRGSLERVSLVALNGYLGPTMGWVARHGGGTVEVRVESDPAPEPDTAAPVVVHAAITIDGLAVERAGGRDAIGDAIGMPLSEAVELLASDAGRLEVELPLEIDPAAPGAALRSVLPARARTGVANAIADRLFYDADFVGSGDVEAIRLAPIVFPSGRHDLEPEALRTIDRLGVTLRHFAGLSATLSASGNAADATALRDLAVLRWVKGERSEEAEAIRAYLAATLALEPPAVTPPLTETERGRLDQLRAVAAVTPEDDAALARARLDAVRGRLESQHGIARDRLRFGPRAAQGLPAVGVELRPGRAR